MNTSSLVRLVCSTALAAVVAGCATVPGDPYYEPARYGAYEQPGVIYNSPPVYSTPQIYGAPQVGYPYGVPPPTLFFGASSRDDHRYNGRDRDQWRERERERDRAERQRDARQNDRRAQERDRDQARRDQLQRDQAQRDRAQREQYAQERERRAAEGRRAQRDDRQRDRDRDAGNSMPGPYDWRARQQSNSFDRP